MKISHEVVVCNNKCWCSSAVTLLGILGLLGMRKLYLLVSTNTTIHTTATTNTATTTAKRTSRKEKLPFLGTWSSTNNNNTNNNNKNADSSSNTTSSSSSSISSKHKQQENDDDADLSCWEGHVRQVPFFYIPPSRNSSKKNTTMPPFSELYNTLESYKKQVDTLISAMILSRDISKMTEWEVFDDDDDHDYDDDGIKDATTLLSFQLEEKIRKTATVLELDYFVLRDCLLQPFHITLGLPSTMDQASEWTVLSSFQDNDFSEETSSAYDSALQVITHIVRDWSVEGRTSRNSLYHWCISELLLQQQYLSSSSTLLKHEKPVLVPGSGLGRLARDISLVGWNVEANELSLSMAAAAYYFLNGGAKCENRGSCSNISSSSSSSSCWGQVHPFAFDFLMNEVESARRFQSVSFPDLEDDYLWDLVHVQGQGNSSRRSCTTTSSRGSLSYTIGDFVEIYAQRPMMGKYGAVVTCFFIDTASNIMEYLLTIRNVLAHGGVWINVGPLQWHRNAILHPSSNELRAIMENMGFTIVKWTVDKETINYRHQEDTDDIPRYTKYEGYNPLRFVAILNEPPSEGRHFMTDKACIQRIQNMRRRILQDGKIKSCFFSTNNATTTTETSSSSSSSSHVTITELS